MDYIQFHFTTEEEIMRHTEYPALDELCREHLSMTKKLLNSKGTMLRITKPMQKEHIVVSDKKLRAHIQTMDA